MELRESREDDWPAILDLADRSVRAVAGAGSQEEWLHHRQRPSGPQRHFVAVEAGALVLVEYAEDRKLLAFLGERGFREARRFRLEDGVECVVVSKRLGGT